MYDWVWRHLPGSTTARVAVAGVLVVVSVAILAFVVVPGLRPAVSGPTVDQSGSDNDDVIEPDGVRQSPLPGPSSISPTPVVPDDGGPQL